MNKKGQLGLDTVRDVLVFALVLSVIAIALFAGVVTVSDRNVIPDTTVNGGTIVNVTINLTDTGQTPSGLNLPTVNSVSYENVILINATDGTQLVASANYSTNSTGAFFVETVDWNSTGVTTDHAGLAVNVSLGFDYGINSDAINIRGNTTNATTQFFENFPTVFAVLGVVLVVLAISLIIFAVRRFSQQAEV